MPRSSPLALPFLASPQPLATYERGHDLCTFVATATSHVLRTLQRSRKGRPGKRKVNHRRFLQNQICRSFADIEAATRRLASSILSQEAVAPPAASHEIHPEPCSLQPIVTPPGSFSGIAEAFVAPDQSPSWSPPLNSLMPDPGELFEPIGKETGATTDCWAWFSPDPSGSSLLGCDILLHTQPHVSSTACRTGVDPNICPPVAAQCHIPTADLGGLVVSSYDPSTPFWDLERQRSPSTDFSHSS